MIKFQPSAFVILKLWIAASILAQDSQPPLEVMRGQYEAMLDIVCEPFEDRERTLFEQYAVAVERLGQAFEENGDVENATLAKAEAKLARMRQEIGKGEFPGIGPVREKLSQEAAKIQAARDAKRETIRVQYLERLKTLRSSLLLAGESEAVNAVLEEARRVSAGSSKAGGSREPKSWEQRDWPVDRESSLVFAWKCGMDEEAEIGGLSRNKVRLMARNEAVFDDEGRMRLVDGSFLARRASRPLTSAIGRAGEMTLETVFTSFDLDQSGPARIITFSTDGDLRNFTLGQSRNSLILRLRTVETGLNGSRPEIKLCPIEANVSHYVLVTYRPGELVTYLDGEEVLRTQDVEGDFSNWDVQQELVFGDEYLEGRNWNGMIEGIAISSQFTESDAAYSSYQAASGLE
tara:strand:+ start:3608 stop:4822 length:1215 start_codon:yes stop_codon:yes gene_type:complete